MDLSLNDRIYFEKKRNYTRNINPVGYSTDRYLEIQGDINVLSSQIRNAAKGALSGDISPNNAKKEISDLLDSIKELKKGDK